jgi:nucleotide-binding universal stress UspA family protein
VREGPAAGTILDMAAAERADTIAMSTHGRTGLARWVPELPLRRAERVLSEACIPSSLVFRKGVSAARDTGADLVAMTTHGRSGVGRWVLGSVTEKVLRAAETPLLVVSARRPAAAPQPAGMSEAQR